MKRIFSVIIAMLLLATSITAFASSDKNDSNYRTANWKYDNDYFKEWKEKLIKYFSQEKHNKGDAKTKCMFWIVNDSAAGTGLMQFNYVNASNAADWAYANGITGAYLKDIHSAAVQNAYFTFRFDGTQIKLHGARGPDQGRVAISFDGGAETIIELYDAVPTQDNILFTSAVLPRAQHTLKVRNTGEKNPLSSGSRITVDRVDVFKDYENIGSLKGKVCDSPGSVSLTASGTADWVHWGYGDVSGFNRKTGVAAQIGNFAKVGNGTAAWQPCVPVLFSWTDGTPVSAVTDNYSGIYITGEGNGFEFTVPAGATEKTLKIYLGAWYAKVGIEATLGDGSCKAFKETIDSGGGLSCKTLVLKYKASADGQSVKVRITVNKAYNPTFGRLILQAAAIN